MTDAISTRYGTLAETSCCLSCGMAAGHVAATPGQTCVDLGSGRGTDVIRLAEQVAPGGHAYGIDITEGMLATARKTAAKLGITNATFLRADLEALPLPDTSVDWVTSNCVLNHASNKLQVWKEIARILKPGGRFVVSDIYAVKPIADVYRSDPAAVAECWAGAVLKDEYLATLAMAGFVDVTIIEESEPYDKGNALVASFTVAGTRPGAPSQGKPQGCCCCS